MENNKKLSAIYFGAAIMIPLFLAVYIFVYLKRENADLQLFPAENVVENVATSSKANNSEKVRLEGVSLTDDSGANVSAEMISGTVSKKLPYVKIAPPDLDRPIPAGQILTDEMKEKISKTIAVLKKDGSVFWAWLDLGILRKNINDYEGARQVWEYANSLYPNNSTVLGNLGDLYGYYIHDSKKAEEYLLKSIAADPNYSYSYIQAYHFYIDVFGDKAKAQTIIENGLKAIPGSFDLQGLVDDSN